MFPIKGPSTLIYSVVREEKKTWQLSNSFAIASPLLPLCLPVLSSSYSLLTQHYCASVWHHGAHLRSTAKTFPAKAMGGTGGRMASIWAHSPQPSLFYLSVLFPRGAEVDGHDGRTRRPRRRNERVGSFSFRGKLDFHPQLARTGWPQPSLLSQIFNFYHPSADRKDCSSALSFSLSLPARWLRKW